jgi:hypothetical protein
MAAALGFAALPSKEPVTGEEILRNNHSASNHDGVGDA